MSHHLTWLVGHGDGSGGMLQAAPPLKDCMTGNHPRKHGLVAMQDHTKVGVARQTINKTGDNCHRPAITAHCINGNDVSRGAGQRRDLRSVGHGARGRSYAASSSRSTALATATT